MSSTRAILLVGQREFAENAKTKGFWIGLFLFPVIIFVSIFVQKLMEESTPTRHYVVVDQSGAFDEAIDEAMESRRVAELLIAIQEYGEEHSKEKRSVTAEDLERAPAGAMGLPAGDGGGEMGGLMEQVGGASATDLEGAAASNTTADVGGGSRVEAFARAMERMGVNLELLLREEGLDATIAAIRPSLVDDAPPFEEPRTYFQRVALPESIDQAQPLDELAAALRPYLNGSRDLTGVGPDGESVELFAAVLIPADVEDAIERPGDLVAQAMAGAGGSTGEQLEAKGPVRAGVQYWAANLADEDLKGRISRAIRDEVHRKEFLARGMDAEEVAAVRGIEVPFASLNPKKEVGKEEVSTADVIRQWAPVAFVYLLWIGIFSISQMLLNNTIEEKSNRIIEVLLSSVTPSELMMGKLAGIACVGLAMIGVWMGSLVTILKLSSGPESEFATVVFEVLMNGGLIPAFVIYFFLGYLLYSGLFLAIGSVCNTLKEAQNLMGPVMLIMMVPIITMMFIPKDPNGTLARVLSWIPLYTPFTMMNRASADPPAIDKYGTLALLVGFTAFTLWAVGRIFRRGILSTGQPPKILEMFRWLKAE